MKGIYLDNGATSYPKAPGVGEAILDYINNNGCSVNRGIYEGSFQNEDIIFETRELICELFNYDKPENVVFTKNITESLNVIIKGLLKSGDHVIVSSMEHNAIMRPLNSLLSKGIEFSRVNCNSRGELNGNDIIPHIKNNTKAIIMTHASNICGTILPLKEVGQIAKENNLHFIVDAAQTAGFLDIDMKELNCNGLCFTGHKGLMGPQGIGGFVIDDSLIPYVSPLVEGGTGSVSDSETQPDYMPDKYEGGTPNICGIFGLNASLKYIKEIGIHCIQEKELELVELFLRELKKIDNLSIVGLQNGKNRTAVVSLDFTALNLDNALVSHELSKKYDIMTRCGLHCAPSAHKTLNTFPQGTVRFSFSHFNTEEEILFTVKSIKEIIES